MIFTVQVNFNLNFINMTSMWTSRCYLFHLLAFQHQWPTILDFRSSPPREVGSLTFHGLPSGRRRGSIAVLDEELQVEVATHGELTCDAMLNMADEIAFSIAANQVHGKVVDYQWRV